MNYNQFGQAYTTAAELCDIIYQNPDIDLSLFMVDNPDRYNQSRELTFSNFPILKRYIAVDYEGSKLDEFDWIQQSNWYMPNEYKELDIAQYVLGLCKSQEELQRVGAELILYQERDLFKLLRYLKYFVDTMRTNNVVWGLGRGSSVASYVLYLLGVHRINSLYYDLPIEEFLK